MIQYTIVSQGKKRERLRKRRLSEKQCFITEGSGGEQLENRA